MKKAIATPTPRNSTLTDPLQINARLYRQVGELLSQLEEKENITLKERVSALIAVGRLQTIFAGLRKEKVEDHDAGNSVRKYSAAFKAHDVSRRAALARSAADEPADTIGDSIFADADDADDERDSA